MNNLNNKLNSLDKVIYNMRFYIRVKNKKKTRRERLVFLKKKKLLNVKNKLFSSI